MFYRNCSLEILLNKKDDGIVVFGTSNMAMSMMEEVVRLGQSDRILYFVDNDCSLWGESFRTRDRVYSIKTPELLRTETRDIRIIVASTYVHDIAIQLESYPALADKECYFYPFIKWRPDSSLDGCFDAAKTLHARFNNQRQLFEQIKNSHQGERCFIIGNGPSLRMSDLEMLKEEYCFGVNQIFFAFNKTSWRPSAYLTVNVEVFLDYQEDIDGLNCALKLIDSKALDYGVQIDNALYLKHGTFAQGEPLFSEDISRYYYNGGTVTYTAMQAAVYMGFKQIYLTGVDNNYSLVKKKSGITIRNDIQDHFYTDGEDKKTASLYTITDVDQLTQSFTLARDYADAHGIEIYNATRGGMLEVFPRVRLEDVVRSGVRRNI